jgi:hypothetical protein
MGRQILARGVSLTRQKGEITLVFLDPHELTSQNGAMQFLGTSTVSREDFPQFVDTFTANDWPSQLINDEKCKTPSTIGED